MTTEKDLIGKSLSLILVSEDEETIVVTGTVQANGKRLMFQNDNEGITISLPDDALQRIRVVTEEVRAILNDADFALMLSVGNLPDGISPDNMVLTGLKWPKKTEGNDE